MITIPLNFRGVKKSVLEFGDDAPRVSIVFPDGSDRTFWFRTSTAKWEEVRTAPAKRATPAPPAKRHS